MLRLVPFHYVPRDFRLREFAHAPLQALLQTMNCAQSDELSALRRWPVVLLRQSPRHAAIARLPYRSERPGLWLCKLSESDSWLTLPNWLVRHPSSTTTDPQY